MIVPVEPPKRPSLADAMRAIGRPIDGNVRDKQAAVQSKTNVSARTTGAFALQPLDTAAEPRQYEGQTKRHEDVAVRLSNRPQPNVLLGPSQCRRNESDKQSEQSSSNASFANE